MGYTHVAQHLPALGYLLTGVLVSLIGQVITKKSVFDTSVHAIPAVKWLSMLAVSLVVRHLSTEATACTGDARGSMHDSAIKSNDHTGKIRRRSRRRRHSSSSSNISSSSSSSSSSSCRSARGLLALLGVLDCAAYTLFCLGFGSCGAAATSVVLPAMGHVLTASFSLILLHKSLSNRKMLAVLLVLCALAVKGWEVDFSAEAGVRTGYAYLGLAALCYSSMGVIYEYIIGMGNAPKHLTLTLYSSSIGVACYVAYFGLYLLPDLGTMVRDKEDLLNSLLWLAAFAILYNVHVYAQGLTFRFGGGALEVQMVNAVRGCVTSCVLYVVGCWFAVFSERSLGLAGLLSGVLAGLGGILWIENTKAKME
jgi:hypothetical protein